MADKLGWVLLHRKIQEHWLCNSRHPFSQFEAWVDILLNVNQETGKPVLIDGAYFTAERGQSLFSLETWGKRWKWDKSRVRRFFERLKNDGMVVINNEKKTTRLTVCNYDTYQSIKHKVDTRSTPNKYIVSKDTINIRKQNFKNELLPFGEKYDKSMINDFYKYWVEPNKSQTKMRFEFEKTWELNLRLSNWSKNQFKKTDFKQQKSYSSEQPMISDN